MDSSISKSTLAMALTTALSLSAGATLAQADMDKEEDMEKCYGVAMAGQNDCKAGPGTSCAGSSTRDYQGNAWSIVAKGTCESIKSPNSPTGFGQLKAFKDM